MTEQTATAARPLLDSKQIQALIPHRWPFLLLD